MRARFWPRTSPVWLLLLGLAACEGGGEGQVEGRLFLRGCPAQGSTEPAGMPEVPAFQLDPTYFVAEPILSSRPDQDPRVLNRLLLRLQRSSHRPGLTDVFTVLLYDTDALQGKEGVALPIVPPPIGSEQDPFVPLPTDTGPGARAGLRLDGTCPFARVTPTLRGSITFSELGLEAGQYMAATFSAVVEDLRGARSGIAPADRAAAGELSGWFRFPIVRGRSVSSP
jgi:hypothetical protein